MTKYKEVTIRFTASKTFQIPQKDDPFDDINLFASDHDLRFLEATIEEELEECPICSKYFKEILVREMETGQEVEGCEKCLDNWEPEEADEDAGSDR